MKTVIQKEQNGCIQSRHFGAYDTLLGWDDEPEARASLVLVSIKFGGFPLKATLDDYLDAFPTDQSAPEWDEIHIRLDNDNWLSFYK
jgi:hypothetical protein